MTEAQLDALNNSLLASSQPDKIIATKHRQMENAIIETIWDIQERGDAFKDLGELISFAGTEKIFVIKNGIAKLLPVELLTGSGLGLITSKGSWNASTNIVPSNGDATIKKGFIYDNGNFTSTTLLGPDGNFILPYATIRALIDNPGPLLSDRTKWQVTYGT